MSVLGRLYCNVCIRASIGASVVEYLYLSVCIKASAFEDLY